MAKGFFGPALLRPRQKIKKVKGRKGQGDLGFMSEKDVERKRAAAKLAAATRTRRRREE